MKGQTYPAARIAAPRIHSLFLAHAAEARRRGQDPVATMPDVEAIEAIIGAAFWASLRREEGYAPKISLAFLSPRETIHPMLFERPLPLEAAPLTRVAPAVERAGIHLGVWPDGDELSVWGTTSSIPATCFVVEVAAPGLLVVKHHRGGELGKFVNVAVLEGDQIKIVDQGATSLPDRPALLSSLVGFDSVASWGDSVSILVQLAVSMRAHGRGGLLLVVPPGDRRLAGIHRAADRLCRVAAVLGARRAVPRLRRRPPSARMAGVARAGRARRGGSHRRRRRRRHDFRRTNCSRSARRSHAARDRRRSSRSPSRSRSKAPFTGSSIPPSLGGTRHLSAAQFVHDQRDALALVASQDGRFTLFAWSPVATMVHAHRVEVLLL